MTAPYRIVLAGCGSISSAWLKAVQGRPDAQVAALVDLNRESAERKASEYHLTDVPIFTDPDEALRRTAPDILFNCTVPEAHMPVTLAALERGCHVLCEKPMADSLANAHRMIGAAKQAGKLLAVIQNRRYNPQIRRLRAFVESDAIGKLTAIQSNFFMGVHFGGFRDHMRHVLILDMAIHTFDAARFLAGADATSVYCHEWNPEGSWYDHDASAVALFEMTGGLVYTYQGSWCADGCRTVWESEWRLIGQKGTVLWNGLDTFRAETLAGPCGGFLSDVAEAPVPEFDCGGKKDSHRGLIHEFLDCVRTGALPETVATDNIKSLAMVHGAIASAEGGRKVSIQGDRLA